MKTMAKMAHAAKVKQTDERNKELILALLDMSAEQLYHLKFDNGIAYAKRMTDNDEMGFDFLVNTRFFWSWWNNDWAKRDAEFIEDYSLYADQGLLEQQYLFTHSVHRLCNDSLMQKKACSMVGYAIDEYMKGGQYANV